MSKVNLLQETVAILEHNGRTPADVRFVAGIAGGKYMEPQVWACGSWDDFAGFADFNYDNGYGGAEINVTLVIVGDNWWLERGEYDGAEWWEFKTLPIKPVNASPLRASDLLDRI